MTTDAPARPPARSLATRAAWRAKDWLTPERRAAVRRTTDPLAGPLGSIRGARVTGALALTFDDGPTDDTPAILDVLSRHDASATFFMLVDHAEAQPERAREVLAAGHEVGLHGLDHRRLTTIPAAQVRTHLATGKRRLEACLGAEVRLFRPPFGSQTPRTLLAAKRCGLQPVVWTADADDWIDHAPQEIAELALARATPGGVLLLHDGFAADPAAPLDEPTFDRAAALDALLTGLSHRRLDALSVGDLLARGRVRRTAWFRP
jgi:peptidoglycan/xylan/chitin deacetylase (PgdA/CDA1 family)